MSQKLRAVPAAMTAAALAAVALLGVASSAEASAPAATADPASSVMGAVAAATTSNGAISAKYNSLGGSSGPLGAPVSAEVGGLKNGGAYQLFQRGAINWSPNSGAHVSMGAIRGAWARNGVEGGPLGYPTSDEIGGLKGGGVYQMYEGGAIVWTPGIGAYATRGAIRGAYAASGFEGGPLGYAVSDEVGGIKDGGSYQLFQNGAINWSPTTGAHVSMGAIRGAWAAAGFEGGALGYPTTEEYPIGGGAVAQNYQNGVITWSATRGTAVVGGAIGAAYLNNAKALGSPLSKEVGGLKDGGSYQLFQNGAINWSPATGAHVSMGAIRGVWGAFGYEGGALGYPTSDEIRHSTGAFQNYQGGAIYWSPTTGAHPVLGEAATKLGPGGGFISVGFPVGDPVTGLVNGGSCQTFQFGLLVSTPTNGVHSLTGAIRTAWISNGSDTGKLGYPRTDAYQTVNGTTQDFDGGQVTVAADGTATVTYGQATPTPVATSAP